MVQHTLILGPSETPAIRCKTCKVPLPDAKRKNCERCRRNRTENYNRWKARKSLISLPTVETHPSSAPSLNVNIRWIKPATTSAACSQPSHQSHPGSGIPSSASLDPYLNEHRQAATSHPSKEAPRLMPSWPYGINEYQWDEELVDALLALPPRSNFFGQFSVIADPDADNFKRAQMFLDQLRSKGLPTSYVAAMSLGLSFVESHPRCLFLLSWAGIHRDLSPVPWMLPASTRSVCTADARLGVKAGSSSQSTTTPRIVSVCLVNVSASHFCTPRDEISLTYAVMSYPVRFALPCPGVAHVC